MKNVNKDEVEYLLVRLVRRGILKKGKYLKLSRQTGTFISYLKYLPSDPLEEKELILELQKHDIPLNEYQEIYKVRAVSPDGTSLTADGELANKKQNINFMLSSNHQGPFVSQRISNLTHNEERPIDTASVVIDEYHLNRTYF